MTEEFEPTEFKQEAMEKKRILLIDDDPDFCQLTAVELQANGYDVITATEGCRAIDLAREKRPDIILLDIVLKGQIDGTKIARQIQSQLNIPVIYLTGHTDEETLARAKLTEPFGYLVKPFEDGELRTSIEVALYKAKADNRLRSLALELDQRNRELKASKESFHNIVERSSDGIMIVDKDGIIKFANPETEKLFSCNCKELIGTFFGQPVVAGEVTEIDIVRSNGTRGKAEMRVAESQWQSQPAHLVLIRDITERKLAEQKIEDLAKFPSENPYPVFRVKDDGAVLYANRTANRLLEEKASGIHRYAPASWRALARNALESNSVLSTETELDGRIYALLAAPVEKGGYVNFYGSDITDQRRTQDALREAIEKANEMAVEAEHANKTKSEFLANISHEIRTPLNGVIGFAELLAQEQLSGPQREHVKLIRECGEHLLALVNDILDFSRIEAGQFDIDLEYCCLKDLLEGIRSLLQPKAEAKGIIFRITYAKNVPTNILTDPYRLRQCLINLVFNAIKFTKQGYVHVNVSSHDLHQQQAVCFNVEDTGIGIRPEDCDKIFESFTQADGTSTREFGGTGLGLTITRKVMELLGGRISLASEFGKGSTFSLIVPVGMSTEISTSPDEIDGEKKIAVLQKLQPQFNGRILVAEDVPTNRILTQHLLEKMGFEVEIAEDGKQALQKALSESFDLILMDIQMPNMNGHEASRKIREKGIAVPIIALTAHAMKGDREECLAAGCNDYLTKPIDGRTLSEKIYKYIVREKFPADQSQV